MWGSVLEYRALSLNVGFYYGIWGSFTEYVAFVWE